MLSKKPPSTVCNSVEGSFTSYRSEPERLPACLHSDGTSASAAVVHDSSIFEKLSFDSITHLENSYNNAIISLRMPLNGTEVFICF